jgi:hypothetical protein
MSVMSRTRIWLLPRRLTSARLRLEGAEAGNCGAGWTAGHGLCRRALEAVVGTGYAVGTGNAVTTGAERLADAVDGDVGTP